MTKEERLIVYKELLKYLRGEEPYNQYTATGICDGLHDIYHKNDWPWLDINIMSYRELMSLKPSGFGAYWFPICATQPRIELVEKAIKMIEDDH